MASGVLHEGGVRLRLLLGLGVIAVLFVLQGVVGTMVAREADARSRSIADNGVVSVEQLSRIVHDVDQIRVALARHVFDEAPTEMAGLQRELARLDVDLEEAVRDYSPLAMLPGEVELWQETQPLLGRFRRGAADVLQLSIQGRSAQARGAMSTSFDGYTHLNGNLAALVALNQRAAAASLDKLGALQASSERVQWGIRTAGLLALLAFGWWGTRRVARYQKELGDHARELERRNRDLDSFAGRVAHDLKNALGPIVMSPALLRRSSANPGQVMEIADRTERCSLRANAIMDALLAFSRAARGPTPDESAALKPVIGDVIEELGPLISHLGVSLDAEDVADVRLRCDPGLLHVVLANLCGNAVKYLEGRAERRVCVRARQEGSWCRIDVEDTGPGIPRQAQARIFEPFFRVEDRHAPGTGIGLATARRILDARGGRISVESAEGRGSRFTVWLPVAPPRGDSPTAPGDAERGAAT